MVREVVSGLTEFLIVGKGLFRSKLSLTPVRRSCLVREGRIWLRKFILVTEAHSGYGQGFFFVISCFFYFLFLYRLAI